MRLAGGSPTDVTEYRKEHVAGRRQPVKTGFAGVERSPHGSCGGGVAPAWPDVAAFEEGGIRAQSCDQCQECRRVSERSLVGAVGAAVAGGTYSLPVGRRDRDNGVNCE